MCPDERRTQHDPVTVGNDERSDTVAKLPRPAESAGVTVQTEPVLRGGTGSRAKKSRKRGNARRTGQNLVVRGVRRDPPDVHKLAKVVASLAADMVETDMDEQPKLTDPEAAGAPGDQQTPRRTA